MTGAEGGCFGYSDRKVKTVGECYGKWKYKKTRGIEKEKTALETGGKAGCCLMAA